MTTEQLDYLPVLSAGRHRNARRGACFMEYASYLAGARWSDHPACTHPALAAFARLVNDLSSDGSRSKLATHIPSVVGLVGDDPRVPVILSTVAAAAALPVASQTRQRALATALVRCEGLLSQWDDAASDRARARIRAAFLLAPGTEAWAHDFLAQWSSPLWQGSELNDETILRTAIIGIADACVPDVDARLERVLVQAIDECAAILEPNAADASAANTRESVSA
jgi:hypothetical protein